MLNLQNFLKLTAIGGLSLLLAPFPDPIPCLMFHLAPSISSRLEAQRMRPRDAPPTPNPQGSNPPAAAAPPQPSAPTATPAVPLFSPSSVLPASTMEQPAKPADIKFSPDGLSIHADNSSLAAILRSLADQSGMKIEGLGGDDERVFGSFGPGNPQDVISDLLNGTPYNILMVGAQSDGAPSHLVLTPTSGTPVPAVSGSPTAQPVNNNPSNPQPTPFAIAPPTPPGGQPGVKSPQALFEELQAMHQQQMQQRTASQ